MVKALFEDIKNSTVGQVVNPESEFDEEVIRKEAIKFIERKMGFKVKQRHIFKSSSLNPMFELEYKQLCLKPRDWFEIFNAFVQENEERPILNKTQTLNILIDEHVNGIEKGICPECGENLLNHAVYCVYCGKKVLSRYRLNE